MIAPSIVPAHYERLRGAALGEALQPEARGGLALFLRRGMWAWACALDGTNGLPAMTLQPVNPMHDESLQHSTAIHLLADLALGCFT